MSDNGQENCIFCKIVAGDLPSVKVYEDDTVLAFLNLQQANPGHTLVVPKEHHRNIFDINEDIAADISRVAVRIARAIKTAFQPEGMNTLQNSEPAAMQSVFHYHLHLIPRYHGDDLLAFAHAPAATPDTLGTNAARIKAAL